MSPISAGRFFTTEPPGKAFIFFFFNLAVPCGLQVRPFQTRSQAGATAMKALSLNSWTTKEFPRCPHSNPGISVSTLGYLAKWSSGCRLN